MVDCQPLRYTDTEVNTIMDPTSHMGKQGPRELQSPTQGHILEEVELNFKPPLPSLRLVTCRTGGAVPGASLTVNHPRGNGWMSRFWALIPCDYRHCDRIQLENTWVSGIHRQGSVSPRTQSCHLQALPFRARMVGSSQCHVLVRHLQAGQIAEPL